MGNSLTIDKKPIIDVLNRSINHVNNELTTSGICKSDVKQKLKVKIKGDLTMKGNCNISQLNSVNVSCLVDSTQDVSVNMSQELLLDLHKITEQEIKNHVEGLPLGVNSTKIIDNAKTFITNNLENIIEDTINSTLHSDTSSENTQILDVEGDMNCDDDGNITQANVFESISENITNQLVDAVIANDANLKIKTEDKTKVDNKIEGLFSSTWFMWFAIAIGAVIVAMIVFMVVKSSTGKGATQPGRQLQAPPTAVVPQLSLQGQPLAPRVRRATNPSINGGGNGKLKEKYRLLIIICILLIINYNN